ncbi:MAG: alpha/beta fold hydrolase [Desulfitobacteriaceae bacterium]
MAKISSIYVNPENKAKIMSIYDKQLSQWPVPYEFINVPTRYGSTHIIASGPKDAPPIMLLHGQHGISTMWLPNILDLSRDYRTYAIDTIGDLGKSELDDLDKYPKNGQAYSEWLVDVFNELSINQAFVIGGSRGGWITINLSIYAPERVKRIILLAPVGISSLAGFILHTILMLGLHPTDSDKVKWLRWSLGDNPLVHELADECLLTSLNCRAKYSWPSRFSNEKLKQITAPTLLFVSGRDPTFNKQKDIDRAVKMISNIQLEFMAGSHAMNVENADFINNRILDFFNSN